MNTHYNCQMQRTKLPKNFYAGGTGGRSVSPQYINGKHNNQYQNPTLSSIVFAQHIFPTNYETTSNHFSKSGIKQKRDLFARKHTADDARSYMNNDSKSNVYSNMSPLHTRENAVGKITAVDDEVVS